MTQNTPSLGYRRSVSKHHETKIQNDRSSKFVRNFRISDNVGRLRQLNFVELFVLV